MDFTVKMEDEPAVFVHKARWTARSGWLALRRAPSFTVMKYGVNFCQGRDCNLSVRSDRARWLTGAHIEHGVRRGRYLHGRAVRQGFLWFFGAVAFACKGSSRSIALWRHRVRMRRHLARMDDRLLRDIGLSRADAKREINKPFWRE